MSCRGVTLLLLLLIASVPAHAQTPRGPAMKVVIVSSLLAHAADLSTTMYALGRRPDALREGNPLFRPLIGHPATFGMAKMGVAVAVNYAFFRVSATHPKAAFWVGVTSSVLTAYVANQNVRQLRRLKGAV